VPFRPLAIVSGLTVGDYLLWNWSLNGNRDVLALVSGLTLPPLAIVLLWLLALTAARLLAHSTRRDTNANARRTAAPRRTARRRRRAAAGVTAAARQTASQAAPTTASSASAARARSSRKIAA
jgi:hypothetical protein